MERLIAAKIAAKKTKPTVLQFISVLLVRDGSFGTTLGSSYRASSLLRELWFVEAVVLVVFRTCRVNWSGNVSKWNTEFYGSAYLFKHSNTLVSALRLHN
jgi:hypothetical protein